MGAKELEALNLLHYSPIDVDGGVLNPLSPVVHDQTLGLTDVLEKVVVLAPHCQVSNLLPEGCVIVAGDQAYYVVLSANLMVW